MNDVFLDTVGMIAVWDDTDQWHFAAKAAYALLLSQGRKLGYDSPCALRMRECIGPPHVPVGVCELRRVLIQEGLLTEPTMREIEQAWTAYGRGEAAQAGIVDHVS